MDDPSVKRNLRLLRLFAGLHASMVIMSVIIVFFQDNGLGMTEIFGLQLVYRVTVIVMEIPTGLVADHSKRRTSIMIGAILSCAAFAVYGFAFGFWLFAVAEFIRGVGASFISGATTSLRYDTLLSAGRQEESRDWASKERRFAFIGMAASAPVGAFVAWLSLQAVPFVQVVVYLPLIWIAWRLKEPPTIGERQDFKIRQALRTVGYALHGHTQIKWLIIFGAVVGTATYPMLWWTQAYYITQGLTAWVIGLLWMVQYLVSAGLSANRIVAWYEKLGRPLAFAGLIAICVVGYVGMGLWPSLAMATLLIGFWFVRAMSEPLFDDYVNRLVEPGKRTTVLSTMSLVQRLFSALVGLPLGWLTDRFTLPVALLCAGGFFALVGGVVLLLMRRAGVLR